MIDAIDLRSDTPALLLEARSAVISYRELGRRIEATRELLRRLPRPAVAFQFAANGPGAVVAYLACQAERVPLGLGEPAEGARERVMSAYQPTAVFWPGTDTVGPEGYELTGSIPGGDVALWTRHDHAPYPVAPHEDLALLLATSGSTGAAKFVRLSRENLLANARAIASYLELGPQEIAIQSLPMHYSYGLSVLNSHLVAGGAVALTAHSFMRPEFWRVVDECKCTSFAGVPYMYETLHRLRLSPAARPSVRTLTQAGGHLRPDLVRHFSDSAAVKGGRFYVMYGQTEATARMAYVPPERLPHKSGSIGVAIPGGEFWIEPVDGEASLGQLFYRGPNVMLGYAAGPDDLARGDDQRGVLATGDLATRDADGYFFLAGRLARFAKLFGKRINLADIEDEIEQRQLVRAAALDGGDHVRVVLEGVGASVAEQTRAHLAGWLGVPLSALRLQTVDRLPLTASGKKNYRALA